MRHFISRSSNQKHLACSRALGLSHVLLTDDHHQEVVERHCLPIERESPPVARAKWIVVVVVENAWGKPSESPDGPWAEQFAAVYPDKVGERPFSLLASLARTYASNAPPPSS